MTFAQRLGAGFAAVILVAALLVAIAVGAITSAAASRERLEAAPTGELVELLHLRSTCDQAVAQARLYLLTGDEAARGRADGTLADAAERLQWLHARVKSESGKRLLATVIEA
jgi:CHASE3 domain sensor protein